MRQKLTTVVECMITAGIRYRSIALLLVALLMSTVSLAQPFVLSGDDWARPRSGHAVAAMPAVRSLVQQWSKNTSDVIVIRYPGGESGNLWALELRDWLVALGIPASTIVIQPGSPNGDEVLLEITAN